MKIKKDGYIYDMAGMKPKQMAEIELALKDRLGQIKKQGKMKKSAETIQAILEHIEKTKKRSSINIKKQKAPLNNDLLAFTYNTEEDWENTYVLLNEELPEEKQVEIINEIREGKTDNWQGNETISFRFKEENQPASV